MKTSRLFLFLGMVFLAGSVLTWPGQVLAVIHEGTDILGLATAPDDTGEFSKTDLPLGTFDLHLLVYGFDHSQGISGWECQIIFPAGVEATGVTLNGKADQVGVDLDTGNLRVFPRIALQPVNGIVHLATLHLTLVDNSVNQEFLLAANSSPETGSTMGFSLETSGSNDNAFSWPGDCENCSVFEIIPSPEPTVNATWSGVKSLYR